MPSALINKQTQMQSWQWSETSNLPQSNHLKRLTRLIQEQHTREEQLQQTILSQEQEIAKYKRSIVELTQGYEMAKQYYEDEIRELRCQLKEVEMRDSEKELGRSQRGHEEVRRKTENEKSRYLYTDRNIYQRFTASSRKIEEEPIKIVVSEAVRTGRQSQQDWQAHPNETKSSFNAEDCNKCALLGRQVEVCEEEVAQLGTSHYQQRKDLESQKLQLEKALILRHTENERLRKRVKTLKSQVFQLLQIVEAKTTLE